MRLLTHNFLQSNVRGITDGYPLHLQAQNILIELTSIDYSMVLRLIRTSKINYSILRNAYLQLIDNSVNATTTTTATKEETSTTSSSIQITVVSLDSNNTTMIPNLDRIESIQQVIENNILPVTLPEQIPTSIPIITIDEQNNNNNNNINNDDDENDNIEHYDDTTKNFLTNLYRILFDIHIQDGQLQCPTTKRLFPIKDGIPNMILHEDEL